MVPVVLTEILSDPKLEIDVQDILLELPRLELKQGFWQRSGLLRAKVLSKGRKARLGDSLIAQCCIDHNISLVTRDTDFRIFAELSTLDLISGSRSN